YSPVLVAAKITARMDILPTSKPFLIVATSDAASSVITVDPTGGTFEGIITVPGVPARHGDFSGSEINPIDFASCLRDAFGGITCLPFPGKIIPASRIPPFELKS